MGLLQRDGIPVLPTAGRIAQCWIGPHKYDNV